MQSVLSDARKEQLPTRNQWSIEHRNNVADYKKEYVMPDNSRLINRANNLNEAIDKAYNDLELFNSPAYYGYSQEYVNEQYGQTLQLIYGMETDLAAVESRIDSMEYDARLYEAQPYLDMYMDFAKNAHSLKGQLNREFLGNFLNKELVAEYNNYVSAMEGTAYIIASIPIVLTDETLSIPEVAKHADVLSMRMPISQSD